MVFVKLAAVAVKLWTCIRNSQSSYFCNVFFILIQNFDLQSGDTKNTCARKNRMKQGGQSIQPKFLVISVQNSMDRFGPSGKVLKKTGPWSTFLGGPLFPVTPVRILVEWITSKCWEHRFLVRDLLSSLPWVIVFLLRRPKTEIITGLARGQPSN